MWQILEWKNRAQVSEQRVEELQMKISELQSKLHTFKAHFPTPAAIPSQDQWSEACKMENPRTKPPHQRSQECGKEEKKHVLICRVALPQQRDPEALPVPGDRQHHLAAAAVRTEEDG